MFVSVGGLLLGMLLFAVIIAFVVIFAITRLSKQRTERQS